MCIVYKKKIGQKQHYYSKVISAAAVTVIQGKAIMEKDGDNFVEMY